MTSSNRLLPTAIAVSMLFCCGLAGFLFWTFKDEPTRRPFDATFSLVDHRGEAVDESIFKGAPLLVYFGYTHCPEVCPTTLFEVAGYLKKLGDDGLPIKTYLFTVDPERDTPEIMNGYVTAFSDRITGVTGNWNEMQRVIAGWRAYAEKVPGKRGGYSMNHTMDLYLIGADGRLKGLIPYGADPDEAVKKIRTTLL